MKPVSRRQFVRTAALATTVARLISSAAAQGTAPQWRMPKASRPDAAPVRWLDGAAPRTFAGATWGLCWPQGQHVASTSFGLKSKDGEDFQLQTWPLATWPDGSLKWTAHAATADLPLRDSYEVGAGKPGVPSRPLSARETGDEIEINTGIIRARIAKSGDVLVPELSRGEETIARQGRLFFCWKIVANRG
jgi:hypothetical protein